MPVINLADPAELRQHRQKHYDLMQLTEARKAELQAAGEELNRRNNAVREAQGLAEQALRALRRAEQEYSKTLRARTFLQHNPPAEIVERLQSIKVALRDLRVEFAQPLRRESHLDEQYQEAKRRLGFHHPTTQAAKAALDELRATDLADFTARWDKLKSEEHELCVRCREEAWPELAVCVA